MTAERKLILQVGFLVEGSLVVLFAIWALLRDFHDKWLPSGQDVCLGLLAAIFLCLLNYLVFGVLARHLAVLDPAVEFIDKIVKPLADQLGPWSGFLVSVLAGVGEELFFRGVLQNELGIVLASALFALLHFGTAVRHYALVAAVYFLIGLYFGFLYEYTKTLWVGIILHIFYDYFALLYLRYLYPARGGAAEGHGAARRWHNHR